MNCELANDATADITQKIDNQLNIKRLKHWLKGPGSTCKQKAMAAAIAFL